MNTPPVQTITIAGEDIELFPPTVAAVSGVLPLLLPIMEASQLDGQANWLRALEANADRLAEGVALATGRPKEWVAALTFDEFIELAVALFETYAAYLRRVAMPKLHLVTPAREG